MNTEGRVQLANRAIFPPGEARDDWAIIRGLAETLGVALPFDSLTSLRKALYAAHPHFVAVGSIEKTSAAAIEALMHAEGVVTKEPFRSAIKEYHLTNAIARASKVMGECAALQQTRHAVAAE